MTPISGKYNLYWRPMKHEFLGPEPADVHLVKNWDDDWDEDCPIIRESRLERLRLIKFVFAKNPKNIFFTMAKFKSTPCDDGVRAIQNIYNRFRTLSGGADGGVSGFNGSIRPKSLAKFLRVLCVRGIELVDFGAGLGSSVLRCFRRERPGLGTSCQ
jgi:hypothetical protein